MLHQSMLGGVRDATNGVRTYTCPIEAQIAMVDVLVGGDFNMGDANKRAHGHRRTRPYRSQCVGGKKPPHKADIDSGGMASPG